MTNVLKVPTHLRVWTNKKYPEILATCFDGTAFGVDEDDGFRPNTENYDVKTTSPNEPLIIDDIPF